MVRLSWQLRRSARGIDFGMYANLWVGVLACATSTLRLSATAASVRCWTPSHHRMGVFPALRRRCEILCVARFRADDKAEGLWSIELVDGVRTEQQYVPNTAVLTTRAARSGREHRRDHGLHSALPPVRSAVTAHDHRAVAAARRRQSTRHRTAPSERGLWPRPAAANDVGSNHVRFVSPDLTLRLTTDASLTAIVEERPFFLEETVTMLLAADETITTRVPEVARFFIEETIAYWRAGYVGSPYPSNGKGPSYAPQSPCSSIPTTILAPSSPR